MHGTTLALAARMYHDGVVFQVPIVPTIKDVGRQSISLNAEDTQPTVNDALIPIRAKHSRTSNKGKSGQKQRDHFTRVS